MSWTSLIMRGLKEPPSLKNKWCHVGNHSGMKEPRSHFLLPFCGGCDGSTIRLLLWWKFRIQRYGKMSSNLTVATENSHESRVFLIIQNELKFLFFSPLEVREISKIKILVIVSVWEMLEWVNLVGRADCYYRGLKWGNRRKSYYCETLNGN